MGKCTADSNMQDGSARGSLTNEAGGGIDLGTGAVVSDCDIHAALGGGLVLQRTQQLLQGEEVLIRVDASRPYVTEEIQQKQLGKQKATGKAAAMMMHLLGQPARTSVLFQQLV